MTNNQSTDEFLVLGYRYNLRFKSRGSYILVGIWCLMAVVLANGYGGVLFSFLSVSKLNQPINSMEELAKSKDVQLAVIDRSGLAIQLMVHLFKNLIKITFNFLFSFRRQLADMRK